MKILHKILDRRIVLQIQLIEMKTDRIIVLSAVIILTMITLSPCVLSEKTGKILYVDDDGDKEFTMIQEALENASDGDTIYVYNGTYYEALQINKSINLIGENNEKTIIEGSFSVFETSKIPSILNSSALIDIVADNVKVSKFTIKNSTKIVPLSIKTGVRPITIDVGSGIKISSNNNTISNNIIIDNGENGIVFISGENTNILNNEISNNSNKGIYLQNCSNNNIINNSITNNSIGVAFLDNAHNNTFYYNNFINNTNYHTSDSGKNIFYSTQILQGNYWDDYNGDDKDNDAIGDEPYTILGGLNQDPYPLMAPYTGRIVLENYYVNEDAVIYALWIAMILAIIFSIPIAYYWYRKTRPPE